jgi:hypothetical protein
MDEAKRGDGFSDFANQHVTSPTTITRQGLSPALLRDVTLNSRKHIVTLAHRDAAVLALASDAPFRIAPARSACCYLVLLRECRNQIG